MKYGMSHEISQPNAFAHNSHKYSLQVYRSPIKAQVHTREPHLFYTDYGFLSLYRLIERLNFPVKITR